MTGFIVICLLVAFYYQLKNRTEFEEINPVLHNTNNSTNLANPAADTEGWKTYLNSKYGYSLQYPADYTITQFEGIGVTEPVTAEANTVRISDKNYENDQFTITSNAVESLSEEQIQNYFNISGDMIAYHTITLNRAFGYQVLFRESPFNYDYYFMQKANGSVMKIGVLHNSDVGKTILSTLSFY